ncbi:hypothetical protein AA801_18125 [Salmonella enterica]|nr:hypothetical protein [Salmonella enterica]
MKFKLKLTYSAWRILGSGHYDIRLFFVKLRKIYGEKSRSIEPLLHKGDFIDDRSETESR